MGKGGDANSKLFHRLLSSRKSKNFISKIELDNGEVLTREKDIIREVVCFFERLYSYEVLVYNGFDGVAWDGIESFLSSWIERLFTEDKVKDAIFDCDGNKAPGPDGFLMTGFQS